RHPTSPLFPYTTLFLSRTVLRFRRRRIQQAHHYCYAVYERKTSINGERPRNRSGVKNVIASAAAAAARRYEGSNMPLANVPDILDRKSTRLNSSHSQIS